MRWNVLPIMALAMTAQAQFAVEELLKPCAYTNETGEIFPFRLHAPQFPRPGKRYPLLLFLHGSGECGTDNRRHLQVGIPKLMASMLKQPEPLFVLAPQCQTANGWVKRLARDDTYAMPSEPTPAMEVALMIVRHLAATRPIDGNRVYVTGLSLGGFGVWDAIQREPALFAAALPICGGGDIRRVREIRHLPVWVFHGEGDQQVSVSCSRRMVTALRQAGNRRVNYTEFVGAPHAVWDRVYADEQVLTWLFRQSRDKKPWWRRLW